MKYTKENIEDRMYEVRLDLVAELEQQGFHAEARRVQRTPMKVNTRMTTTAGYARYRPALQVDIAFKVFAEPVNWPELANTLRHEFAHILAWTVDREKGHGKAWKHWAEICGNNGKRCHSMQVARRYVQRVTVIGECDRCGAETRAKRGTLAALIIENKRDGSVTHRNCGGEFKYLDLC